MSESSNRCAASSRSYQPVLALCLLLAIGAGGLSAQQASPGDAAPTGSQSRASEAAAPQPAPSVTQHGELYRARLSGIDSFHAVVEILRAELFQRGWTEQEQTDVDIMLRTEGMLVHNKLVSVLDPERFAAEIGARPSLSLLAAQRILVYQKDPKRSESYRAAPGDIVIELVDPAVKARALGVADTVAVGELRRELLDAVAATERFFRGPEGQRRPEPPFEAPAGPVVAPPQQ
jgi:hypothetical protein